MVDAGVGSPSAREIAQHAGVGLRTVFDRFADMDDLQLTATAEKFDRLAVATPVVPDTGSLDHRIDAMTAVRATLHEEVTAVRLAAQRQECCFAALRALVDGWDHRCALDIVRVFGPEFTAMSGERRDNVGAAVETAWSWSYWNQLRQRRSLSIDRSASIVSCAVRALLR